MKQFVSVLCCSVLLFTAVQADYPAGYPAPLSPNDYGMQAAHTPTSTASLSEAELVELRIKVTQQTLQIKEILTTLYTLVEQSPNSPDNLALCEEIKFLRNFIEQFCPVISDMDAQELANLMQINNILLQKLEEQIATGELSNLQGIDSSLLARLQNNNALDAKSLQEQVAQTQRQLDITWNLLTPLTISAIHTSQASPSFLENSWKTIQNYRGLVSAATALVTLDQMVRYANNNNINLKEGIALAARKTLIYSLTGLYLLRQKKDKDVADFVRTTFEKDSILGTTVLYLKDLVGSPKNKKTAVHVIARHDMTAKEQLDWAKANDCAAVELDRGRNYDFLKHFFEFEDGLVKLPLLWFFVTEAKQDVMWLAKKMGGLPEALVSYDPMKHTLNPQDLKK